MRSLLISNDASHTGAPFVVLNLAKWIKQHTPHDCDILVRLGGGALESSFEDVAQTWAYDKMVSDRSLLRRAIRRTGLRRLGSVDALSAVEKIFKGREIDVVVSNTVTNGGLIADLVGLKCPVISYIHELESMIEKYGAVNMAHVKRHTTHFVAGSQAVAKNLQQVHGIAADKMSVVHGFISVADIEERLGSATRVRHMFGIADGTFVVGGSGFTNVRKGKDLFVQLAAKLREHEGERPMQFMWAGGVAGDTEAREMQHWIDAAGLTDVFNFIPDVDNHVEHTAAFDVLATTSREDPYPLTNLEAGLLGKPVVCFEGAGGSPEFVEDDAGFVVPFMDVDAMARRILELYHDEALRKRLGERAAEKVRERHDVATAGKALMDTMERIVKDAG